MQNDRKNNTLPVVEFIFSIHTLTHTHTHTLTHTHLCSILGDRERKRSLNSFTSYMNKKCVNQRYNPLARMDQSDTSGVK